MARKRCVIRSAVVRNVTSAALLSALPIQREAPAANAMSDSAGGQDAGALCRKTGLPGDAIKPQNGRTKGRDRIAGGILLPSLSSGQAEHRRPCPRRGDASAHKREARLKGQRLRRGGLVRPPALLQRRGEWSDYVQSLKAEPKGSEQESQLVRPEN
jgi:hypothetical protein